MYLIWDFTFCECWHETEILNYENSYNMRQGSGYWSLPILLEYNPAQRNKGSTELKQNSAYRI